MAARVKLSPQQIELLNAMGPNPTQEQLNRLGVKSENTQIETTIADRLAHLLSAEERKYGISIGAGKGIGAKRLGLKTHEPFPQGWSPDYTDVNGRDIPSNAFKFVLNTYVLNVVGRDTRDNIVKTIGRVMKSGGRAIIVTRGSDVNNSTPVKRLGPMEVINAKNGALTYQKGFALSELISYVQSLLGPKYEVVPLKGTSRDSVKVLVKKM